MYHLQTIIESMNHPPSVDVWPRFLWGTQSAHSLCKVSHAIDSDAGDGSNREKFGRKDPGL